MQITGVDDLLLEGKALMIQVTDRMRSEMKSERVSFHVYIRHVASLDYHHL